MEEIISLALCRSFTFQKNARNILFPYFFFKSNYVLMAVVQIFSDFVSSPLLDGWVFLILIGRVQPSPQGDESQNKSIRVSVRQEQIKTQYLCPPWLVAMEQYLSRQAIITLIILCLKYVVLHLVLIYLKVTSSCCGGWERKLSQYQRSEVVIY